MSEIYFFSGSKVGFYAASLKESVYDQADAWPDDAVLMSDEDYILYSGPAPDGKILGSSQNGAPSWIDAPKPTDAELVSQAEARKIQLLSEASIEISPLQDAVDEGMATEEEVARLSGWKKYRVSVNRVDTSSIPVIFPEKPY